ncbi:MAG: ribonuclease M5, partial [Malacoplasma sp.]|nr:ribonuclease M5 [Malacoplasma sp.]
MQQNISKPVINEVVVVEGKSDTSKLKSIFTVDTIETNGLSISEKKIKEIISVSQKKGIILFLDPDGPGEKIRKKLTEIIPNTKQCFIEKKDIKKGKKIGVAEASVESIINAFKNITKFSKKNNSIDWKNYLELDLNSKRFRIFVCKKLNISYCNHKQLFKRLNMLNLSYDDVKKLLQP